MRCPARFAQRLVVVALLTVCARPILAQETTLPLHERIDALVDRDLKQTPAPAATDGEFLRRLSLDLTGRIPTAQEARAFLDDPSPYKRMHLVDRLLASPEHARHLANWLDVMLMERRADQHVKADAWRDYLYRSRLDNKPFDQLAREILSSDGGNPETRAASKFFLDRGGDPNLITRDVGRVFLGIDMQCAQCHDHPLIDDYKQAHYYGLFAFFSRGQLVQDATGLTTLGEKADGNVEFASVFGKKVKHSTGPRIIDGPELPDPPLDKGQEYWSFPADKNRVIPRHSRRAQLSEHLVAGAAPAFARNIANRLWAHMIGAGIVQPLDMHHAENPPTHPELLDLLTTEFQQMHYDINAFLREIALSDVYARSSEAPDSASAEPEPFTAALVRPLTPEQLGWSVMQATGVLANYRAAAEYSLLKTDPKMAAILQLDAKRQRLRDVLIEGRLFEQLQPSTGSFIYQFASAAGQSQEKSQANVHQALMLSNGEPIQSWLQPSGENLTARLKPITDNSALAEELYLSILTRRPTPQERADVADYLTPRAQDRDAAVRELAWALLASLEFRFNH